MSPVARRRDRVTWSLWRSSSFWSAFPFILDNRFYQEFCQQKHGRGAHQARKLLDSPEAETSKRDRAILSTLLFHALRRESCAS
jgi:hypothetical protein